MTQNLAKSTNQDDKIKILMIIGGLGAGGKERQLITLVRELKRSGVFSIHIAVLNPGGSRMIEASLDANQLIPIKRTVNFDPITPLIHLVSIAKKEKIQIIHTWGSGIWDIIGLLVARICQIPFLHGGIRSAPETIRFSNQLTKWSARRADAIVANSQAGLIAFGVDQDPRSRVIYNGIDMTRFEGLSTTSERNKLCMVANFSDKKDHHTLVSALPLILKAFPNVRLTLVGHDAGTLKQVKYFVSELGMEEQVDFITDTLNPEPFIAESKVGILATNKDTHGEGTANALLEYMALAKPVVVSDSGGNREVVIENETGYFVPPNNAELLAEKVIQLLKYPDIAQEMGIAGRRRVEEKFSTSQMVSNYKALYSQLLE